MKSCKESVQTNNINKTNIVVNISKRKLSAIEVDVLNKGLNFCITSNNNINDGKILDEDINKFNRTLQLKYMFGDNTDKKQEKFSGNPKWKPPQSKCSLAIAGFTNYLKLNIKKMIKNNKIKHNISRMEREALKTLKTDKTITIQKADKGGSIVILDTETYNNKMLEMLKDPITYTQIDNLDLTKAKQQVDSVIIDLFINEYITKKQKQFLIRDTPKLPKLYGLPKIHKPNNPMRPIVSQIDSPAYYLNKYLDYLLTTAEKSIPNLLQDTTKFLQIISALGPLPTNSILFTIDVTSLYTVLPHALVINYVEEFYTETLKDWMQYTPDIKPIPGENLKQIINIILQQTFFQFNDNNYIQNYGITMGAPASVKLANITLYKHLQKILHNYPHTLPTIQLRLIDDIFGIWPDTEESLKNWVTFLNDSHTTIKFTTELSPKEIPFLDTLVYIENNKLKTKLYKKPTDNKQYLHFDSDHPKHVKKSIPYAQALRYRRIIEDNDILKTELTKLKSNFTTRNYPEDLVNAAINKVINLDRNEVIKYKTHESASWNSIPFVIRYNNVFVADRNKNIYKLLTEAWSDLLQATPELEGIPVPKIVFKKGGTIGNLLVNSTSIKRTAPPYHHPVREDISQVDEDMLIIPPAPPIIGRSLRCGKSKCKACVSIKESKHFHSSYFNKNFALKNVVSCDTSNIIYLITCTKCKIQYVGETHNTLRERLTGHRSCISTNKDTPIGIHFNSLGHTTKHLEIIPIEKLETNSIENRRTKEFFWQITLGTTFPKGLNNFPVENRHLFNNLEINTLTDLEVFTNLKDLEDNADG